MTRWIQLPEPLRLRAGIPDVALPVSDATAMGWEEGTADLADLARDVAGHLAEDGGSDPNGRLLGRAAAGLAYLQAFELLEAGEVAAAIDLLELGLANEPDDEPPPEPERRGDAVELSLGAVRWCGEQGHVPPALWIITSRVLRASGSDHDVLTHFDELVETPPTDPRFRELVDAMLGDRGAVARDACRDCGALVPGDAHFCTSCGAPQPARCLACGHTVEADAAFCTRCGRAQGSATEPPAAPSRCAGCGTELSTGTSFCTACGRPVPGAAPPPQAATPTVVVAAPSQPAPPPPPAQTATYAAPDPSTPTAEFPPSPAAPVAPDYSAMAPTASGRTEHSVRGALLAAAIGLLVAGAGLFFGWIRVPGMSIGDGAAPLDGPTPFRIGDWLDTSVKVDGIAVIVLVVAGATVLTLHIMGRLGGRIAAGTLSGLAALLLMVGLLQLQYIADLGSQFTGSRFQADLGLLLVLGGAVFTLALALLSLAFDRSA